MSKKNQSNAGKPGKANGKAGGFKAPSQRSTPMSRRPPRQPGR